jgi:raffinose/stachyose/melibiose transport system permease protein
MPMREHRLSLSPRGGIGAGRRLTRHLPAYLFLVPTFVFIAYFLYYPAITALFGAFTTWDGFNAPAFVGIDNFKRVIGDAVIQIGARNNLIWAALQVCLSIIPAFVVAELIFHVRSGRLKYLYRTLFVVPVIVPLIVVILLWTYFYQHDGLLNVILDAVHLTVLQHDWLADTHIALYSLILLGFPWVTPFNLLIFYAGLQSIGAEVLESAQLDGASTFRRVLAIDIPLVLAQFKLLFILAVIASVQNIVIPLVMTNGGPGYATQVPALYMYQVAVTFGQFGYSMAISFMLFVVCLGCSGLIMRFVRGAT